MDIVFIGSSAYGLECLIQNENFRVLEAICLTKRVTPELEAATKRNGLNLIRVEWKKEFTEAIKSHPADRPFFIYQLDMLVPAKLTEEYSFFNVHRGDLMTNRGPSPDIWPVLKGDSHSALSLHKINDKVDSGVFVDEYRVALSADETVPSLKMKLEKGLPQLIDGLTKYLRGEKPGKILDGGNYRPWVTEEDFTINPETDSFEVIERKIRSQSTYNGAIVHYLGLKLYINSFQRLYMPEVEGFSDENRTLVMSTLDGPLKFGINTHPKYAPPPKMKPSNRI